MASRWEVQYDDFKQKWTSFERKGILINSGKIECFGACDPGTVLSTKNIMLSGSYIRSKTIQRLSKCNSGMEYVIFCSIWLCYTIDWRQRNVLSSFIYSHSVELNWEGAVMNVLDEKKVEKKMSIPSILLGETYAKNIYEKKTKNDTYL